MCSRQLRWHPRLPFTLTPSLLLSPRGLHARATRQNRPVLSVQNLNASTMRIYPRLSIPDRTYCGSTAWLELCFRLLHGALCRLNLRRECLVGNTASNNELSGNPMGERNDATITVSCWCGRLPKPGSTCYTTRKNDGDVFSLAPKNRSSALSEMQWT